MLRLPEPSNVETVRGLRATSQRTLERSTSQTYQPQPSKHCQQSGADEEMEAAATGPCNLETAQQALKVPQQPHRYEPPQR